MPYTEYVKQVINQEEEASAKMLRGGEGPVPGMNSQWVLAAVLVTRCSAQ